MQLASSVFGVCIIQIKPQLELLLGLQSYALTKEMQLTQDLMSLFIDYQIPSDLVTYSNATTGTTTTTSTTGSNDATVIATQVQKVKGYVKGVMDVITATKKKQLKEEEMKSDMRMEMFGSGKPQHSGEGEPIYYHSFQPRSAFLTTAFDNDDPGAKAMAQPMAFSAPAPVISQEKGSAGRRRLHESQSKSVVQQPQQHTTVVSSTQKQQLQKQSSQKQQQSQEKKQQQSNTTTSQVSKVGSDFTLLPTLLDSAVLKMDTEGAVRSTIIKSGPMWTRSRHENLLVPATTTTLSSSDIDTEQKKAFDLLDAISRSGTLPIASSELHVVVALSHCFDNDIMGTVIQDNVNPITNLERSATLLASTIWGGVPPTKLLNPDVLSDTTSSSLDRLTITE
jgi:hypothetical protein